AGDQRDDTFSPRRVVVARVGEVAAGAEPAAGLGILQPTADVVVPFTTRAARAAWIGRRGARGQAQHQQPETPGHGDPSGPAFLTPAPGSSGSPASPAPRAAPPARRATSPCRTACAPPSRSGGGSAPAPSPARRRSATTGRRPAPSAARRRPAARAP